MDGKGHSRCTRAVLQILEIHAVGYGMNVHARIEWNLTKVNIDQQSIFILTGVEANGVGTAIEIGLSQSAVNGGVLHIRVC